MPGTLYLVATPIGNLQDMTFRAVEILKSVEVIACEDTRHTRKLANHFGISTKLVSYHEHNEAERSNELIAQLQIGVSVAVVSDAGTPGISDPGFHIVNGAIAVGIPVVPIPGAVAFLNAVAASGLPTDSIFFGGFLPSRKADRRKRLQEIAAVPATLAFYESPRRIADAIADAQAILGDRRAVVARELTKMHEEVSRGRLSELHIKYSAEPVKGEIVLMIDRAGHTLLPVEPPQISIVERVAELIAGGVDRKTALKQAAKEFRLTRSEAYRQVQIQNK